jgi:hypothetical protein
MTNQAKNTFLQKPLQFALIFFGAVLVGIWAMQHTIALRNSLLGLGAIVASFYSYAYFKTSHPIYPLKNFIPLIMLGLVLLWVLAQYFFLSEDPVLQYQELTSTWSRCLLATIMGFGTGLAITKKPSLMQWLWVGLSMAIVTVYVQYIPRAWHVHNLIQIDYSNYIFYGKHNVVMVGTLLIAGLLGSMADQLVKQIGGHQSGDSKESFRFFCITSILKLFMIYAVLFIYVFLFDTRNGIGLAVILFVIATLIIFLPSITGRRKVIKRTVGGDQKNSPMVRVTAMILLVSILTLGAYFAYRQTQMNQGWVHTVEDAKIAVQIDRYPNWKNPSVMGYPKTESGRVVTVNTYERLAWAVAAAHLIMENPLGNGVLHYSFRRSLEKKYPNTAFDPNAASASHSAWIELGLTLGLPGLALLMGSLLLLLRRFWVYRSPFANTGFMLCIALLLLYTVAELIGQHGLESLFFWVALLSGLQFWVSGSTQRLPSN